MEQFTLKRYSNAQEFLKETKESLKENEGMNTFVLLMAENATKQDNDNSDYGCAVWDQQKLVFALFVLSNTMIYPSFVLHQHLQAANLALDDFTSCRDPHKVNYAFGFEPILGYIRQYLEKYNSFQVCDAIWSYELNSGVTWSPKLLDLKNDTRFKLERASPLDFDVSLEFTLGFLQDIGSPVSDKNMMESVVKKEIDAGNIYLLKRQDESITMAWKRRPTDNGCAIAYVFTPQNERRKGYAGLCVGLLSEELLKSFQFTTLFVETGQDPHDNLYSRLGYQYNGMGGRLNIV